MKFQLVIRNCAVGTLRCLRPARSQVQRSTKNAASSSRRWSFGGTPCHCITRHYSPQREYCSPSANQNYMSRFRVTREEFVKAFNDVLGPNTESLILEGEPVEEVERLFSNGVTKTPAPQLPEELAANTMKETSHRTRDEIEDTAKTPDWPKAPVLLQAAILEVLLDIRELLASPINK